MSYGPGPTSVGTLFMNANNTVSSLWTDATHTPGDCNTCNAGGPGDGGIGTGGGGAGGGSCGPIVFHPDMAQGGGGSGSPVVPLPIAGPGQGGDPVTPCWQWDTIMVPLGKPCQVIPLDALTGLSPGCVAPHSRIALFPEGCLAAAEVQIGDLLMTRRADGTLTGEVVTALRTSTQPCVRLETEAGQQLHCSLSHEIMVADPTLTQGRRTLVSELTLDDCLLTEEGTPVALRAMIREPNGPVIQLSLSGPEHLYLSDCLWSHNKPQPIWPVVP